MKKRVPIPLVILILLVVAGICGFIYIRMPIERPPNLPTPPFKPGFSPHQHKQDMLKAQEERDAASKQGTKHPKGDEKATSGSTEPKN